MIRDALQQIVSSAVTSLVTSGQVPEAVRSVRIEITDTKQPEHGDFACNFALTASKSAAMNPRQLGELLRSQVIEESKNRGIEEQAGGPIQEIELAGPGFLNFRLNPAWQTTFVSQVLEAGTEFGKTPKSKLQNPKSINVEFVSVNPNGPITIGSGRGAAYGSTLCNVLEAAGNKVHREYYINDGVNSEQMRLFAESVRAFAIGIMLPENGYKGDYVSAVADEAKKDQKIWLDSLNMIRDDLLSRSDHLHRLSDDYKALRVSVEDLAKTHIENLTEASKNISKGGNSNAQDLLRKSTEVKKELYAIEQKRKQVIDEANSLQRSVNEYAEYIARVRDTSETAKDIFKELGGTALHLPLLAFQVISQAKMLAKQKEDLSRFGTLFDTWFSEQSLHDSGVVAKEIDQMVASQVADDQEIRTVLKLAKGGVIDDVLLESQAGKAEVEDEHGEAPVEEKEDLIEQSNNPTIEQSKTLWLRSAKFGDDMDRVLKRRDGRLTYIASDVAYHKDKLTDASGTRGTGPVDKMITILGPDHHGYIGRLQAVVAAMLKAEGLASPCDEGVGGGQGGGQPLSEIEAKIYSNPEERDLCKAALAEAKQKLEVQIYQLVRFVKDGKPAPMRKRDGNIYALIDLMREIGENVKPNGTEEEKLAAGKDVARFFYLMRSHDTTFDFDLDLAQKQSDENPVFYVQYAHARICSVIAKAAAAHGMESLEEAGTEFDSSLLTHERELALIRKICDLPYEVQRCAEDYGVHRLATYAIELARTYHHFYDACRVIQPEEPKLTRARLALCEATRVALKGTLDLLGISAPQRMERTD